MSWTRRLGRSAPSSADALWSLRFLIAIALADAATEAPAQGKTWMRHVTAHAAATLRATRSRLDATVIPGALTVGVWLDG